MIHIPDQGPVLRHHGGERQSLIAAEELAEKHGGERIALFKLVEHEHPGEKDAREQRQRVPEQFPVG